MEISHEQLAELLIGIAKAETAVARLSPEDAVGLVMVPALQQSSGINAHRPATLSDLPQRLLLRVATGNVGSAMETARRELARLLP